MANNVWQDLESHHDQHADDLMTDLFASNPDRAKHYCPAAGTTEP